MRSSTLHIDTLLKNLQLSISDVVAGWYMTTIIGGYPLTLTLLRTEIADREDERQHNTRPSGMRVDRRTDGLHLQSYF